MLRYWMAFGLVMLAFENPANRRCCFAQSPSLQPSTAEQINFLQQQIDQLKLDAGIEYLCEAFQPKKHWQRELARGLNLEQGAIAPKH